MVNRILIRKLSRDMMSRKGSLLALVAIVAVGVGIYTSMGAVYLDLDGARQRYYSRYGMDDFSVDLKRAPEWTRDVIQQLANVKAVRGRVKQAVLIDLEHRVEPVPGMALSLPPDRRNIVDAVMMRSGIGFSGDEAAEVILEHQFAQANHLEPGDRIKAVLMDKQHNLLVVGTAMSPEFVYLIPPGGGLSPDPAGYGVMYLPRKFLQNSSDLDGAYNQLVGLVNNNSRTAVDDTLDLIQDTLEPYGVTNTTPVRDNPSASILRDELINIKTTASIFPAIFLGVAALVLNIIMSRMVAQQRVVVGTLRALGYSSWDITIHYLGHGLLVGVAGGVLGILFGWWLQVGLLDLYRQFFAMPGIEAHVHAAIMLKGAGIAIFFALIGTIKGARSAAKLEPAEAMRPPPPEKGGKIVLERVPAVWSRLPFHWKMIFRAIFRNPFRSVVTVTASAIATGLIVASFSTFDSTYFLINYHFSKISHENLTISLREPVGTRSVSEVANLPAVSRAEPQLVVTCDFRNGPYQKRTGITALARGNLLYTPLDRSGRQIVVPQEGLILSRKLAEILHVGVGDFLKLRPLIARREETKAPIVGIVDTYLGISAYCDIHYLSTLLGEYWSANAFLISSFPDAPTRDLMKEVRKRPGVIGISERMRSLMQMEKTMGEFMGTFFGVVVIFAGIIAFGSLLNTALVSLSERQREVGTLRVLGYRVVQVLGIFSGESLVLNGVGIAIGLGLGVGIAHLLSLAFDTELYRFPAVIRASRMALATFLMLSFVACAQLVVYRMIRRLDWLEVLKVKE